MNQKPTDAATEHKQVAGWGGVPGECGVECACGTTFDNFDTIAEAAELLDKHILDADPRAAFITGLELIAAFLRDHPEVPLPSMGSYPYEGAGYEPTLRAWTTHQFGDTRSQKQMMADTARALGNADKGPGLDETKFVLYRKFAGVWFVLQADRAEVCERVVTGTREVVKTVPDPEALAAVPTVEVTETVEDVKWVCRPLLAPADSDDLSEAPSIEDDAPRGSNDAEDHEPKPDGVAGYGHQRGGNGFTAEEANA